MFANISLCALQYLLCLSHTHLVIISTATHTPVEFAVVLVMAAAACQQHGPDVYCLGV